jgi:hypothetical protein
VPHATPTRAPTDPHPASAPPGPRMRLQWAISTVGAAILQLLLIIWTACFGILYVTGCILRLILMLLTPRGWWRR